ncbi:MAG: 5-bromo-4-chloroindolyl phosphate hydrolysis family protein [Spirochaetes bacterium]|nr:5-bromo-4-chloroindolyl phosphate hydrolysis family protein [Spirochaetota bacterium]
MKRAFASFLVGTAVFGICFQFTVLGFLLSSVAGVTAMVLLNALMKAVASSRRAAARRETAVEKSADEVVKEGMEKLRQISNAARMIRSNEIAGEIRDICKVGVDIFDYIRKHPDRIGRVKQFTNYYLDATKKIVEQYAELSLKTNPGEEVTGTLGKIEGMLASIRQTFERQLGNLMEDRLLDLNAELAVLKNTMKMEG